MAVTSLCKQYNRKRFAKLTGEDKTWSVPPKFSAALTNCYFAISVILPDTLCLTLTNPLRYNFYAKFISRIGGVAQLGERLTGSQEVMGSIPTVSTILKTAYSCE